MLARANQYTKEEKTLQNGLIGKKIGMTQLFD